MIVSSAGRRYEALMDEWTTDVDSITDAQGRVNFRGFHGTYEITLTPPDAITSERKIKLHPDTEIAEFILYFD